MKKLIILIVAMLCASNIFAATYTFNLYGMQNISGIYSPKYGTTQRLDNRAQSFMMSLNVPAAFAVGDADILKRNLQTMVSSVSESGLSVTKAQVGNAATGRVCEITFALTTNNTGSIRTFDFTYSAMGPTNKVSFTQAAKNTFDISPSYIYILPSRTYTFTLSGSISGKTYSLMKNGSQISTKSGTGSALDFSVSYGALSAGLADIYTVKEGDNEFRGCTMVYFDEIAQKRYQTSTEPDYVDATGGNIVVRCEWPGYNDIGRLFQIIELMNNGSYSYMFDNQKAVISVVDYDASSYCILNFKISSNTGSTSRIFNIPFIFNNGNQLIIRQFGLNPARKDHNWITRTKYNTASGDSKTITTTYLDGLRRPMQQVQVGVAADQSKKDIINIIRYDALGRNNSMVYLPYAKQQQYAGSYSVEAIEEQREYYAAAFGDDGDYAYTENEFEQSALNRIITQTKVGKVYRDQHKQTHYTYAVNAENEVFRIVPDSTDIGFSVAGYFAKASLYKSSVTDEDGNIRVLYYNSDNQLMLERKVNENNNLDTYYTYDEFGTITNVIPPQASRILTTGMQCAVNTELFANFCYGYKYDHNGNITMKKIPGKEIELSVYDKSGRPVMYQDGVMRTTNSWAYIAYDNFNNQVSNKIVECKSAQLDQNAIQQKFDAEAVCQSVDYNTPASSFVPYNGFNTDFSEVALLKELKYYGLGTESTDATPGTLAFKDVVNIASSKDIKESKGSKRYEKLKYLDGANVSTDSGYTDRVFYYDTKGRLIQRVEQHPTGVLSRYSYKYDFNDNLIASQEAHTVNGRTDSLNSYHNIYNGGQLTSSVRNLNNSIEATINYTRNELGKMVSKDYGNAANNLKETYKYNIQGWLTEQSCERFSSKLRYYNPKQGASPSYTGNITEWEWAHPDLYMSGYFTPTAVMPDSCCYLYSYDNLSRLRSSQLTGYDPYYGSWKEMGTQGEAQSYDFNGNLTTLQRQDMSGELTDNFTYTYSGNQLSTLRNNAQSYTYAYDANGNMINDGLNSLRIKYNCLNLVQDVTDLNNIPKAKYAYLADGTKLGVKDRLSRNGYEYYGSFRYAVVNGVKKLESVPYEGGRIIVSASGSGASMTYSYNINAYTTDHLMSTRGAKYNVSDSAYEDYYSFGKGWENPAYSSNFDKYTYNGKEMQTTGWLPYLDYGARMYDPRIGRWFGQDPLAEENYSTSPYAFCANNPINFVDMFGLEPERVPGGFYDFDFPEGSIDAVVITGYSWRNHLRSTYASNYGPYVSRLKTVSTSISGGGGGGSNGASANTNTTMHQKAKAIEKINEIIKNINDPVGVASALAKAIVDNKTIAKIGNTTTVIGGVTTTVDFGVTMENISTGYPWGESAIDTGIGIIGFIGLPGAMAAFSLSSYKDAFMYLYDQYVLFEQRAQDWMKAKIVPGYRP